MRGIIKIAPIAIAATVLVLLTFVPKALSPETPVQQASFQQSPLVSLTLYFSDKDATRLLQEKRTVRQTEDMPKTAVEELLAGSSTPELVTVIPRGTKLISLSVKQGIAFVDLTSDILNTPNRGSASESMIVTSIVNTLTEFPEIEKVQILIDGKNKETLYGHMDLSQPFTRFRESAMGEVVQAFRLKPRVINM